MPTPTVIDIYHGNVVHDFAQLKASGIVGVIHKCTQGRSYSDPLYESRRKLATDVGLLWGAYAFNTGESVFAQVEQFIVHAEPDANTLMALDFEDNPHSQMTLAEAKSFLKLCADKLGRKLVLYSGNRAKDLLGRTVDPYFGGHRLWLPQYGPTPKVQASWQHEWLWQYSENGKLPGTDGMIDLNSYSGTDLKLEWAT